MPNATQGPILIGGNTVAEINDALRQLVERVDSLTSPSATYTVTNVTTDRTYDADAATTAEVADVLGTLIADLQARGVVQ